MKYIYSFGAYFLIFAILTSCKKSSIQYYTTSSITVINGIQNAQNIVVNFSDTAIPYYLNQAPIAYGSSVEYGIYSGKTPLTVVSAADTSGTLINGTIDLKAGGIYSLYFAGQNGKSVDTLFMKDMIPVYSDSVAAVRFINLSVDARNVSVNLEGNVATQMDFSALGYKQISAFKSYSANSSAPGYYTFEVRDQATGDLLTTFTWNYTIFKNNTLVLSGSTDPSAVAPIGVFQVNNF